MEEDDTLMLNLSTGTTGPTSKRRNLPKADRIRQKKQERRQQELAAKAQLDLQTSPTKTKNSSTKHVASEESSSGPSKQQDNRGKKRKRRDVDGQNKQEETEESETLKRFKSTLFYNNPEIPKLESSHVEALNEKVFSGENFTDLNLHNFMVSNLEQTLGVTKVTSVQKATIPHMLVGKDVLVKSQTGSGKTLSYAVPIVQELQSLQPKIRRSDGVLALVIVPTRELALQTLDAFQKLVKPFTWVVPGCVMGGENKSKEKARLRKGINILVSTPGRLMDHIEHTHSLELGRVQWLVIDEADRLLDMGFERDVSQIITALKERGPKDRKTVLLSATLNTGVERLAGMSLQSPVKVDITTDTSTGKSEKGSTSTMASGNDAGKIATPVSLKHHCVIVPSKLRLVTLAAFILWKCKMATKRSKMLVFMSTQDAVDFHYRLFQKCLFETEENKKEAKSNSDNLLYRLHGDMPQKERTTVFNQFSAATSGVLFCTDVAARGLDLPQVRWIVQYMSPAGSTDYIHRVGRTARIGSRGNALLFLTPAEAGYTKLLSASNISLIEVEMNDILQTLLVEKQRLDYLWEDNDPPHTIQEAASLVQVRFTEHVRLDRESRTQARKAYQSFIGAYTAYPASVKHIFHVKSLHLGHVATSFGLQEAPTKIGNIVGTQLKKQNTASQRKTNTKRKGSLPSSMHSSNLSEFSSGFNTKISQSAKFTKKEKKRMQGKKS